MAKVLFSNVSFYNSDRCGEPLPRSVVEQLFFTARRILTSRGQTEAAGLLAILDAALIPSGKFDKSHILEVPLSLSQYNYFRTAIESPELEPRYGQLYSALDACQTVLNEAASNKIWITTFVFELSETEAYEGWREELFNSTLIGTSNQGLFTFTDTPKLVHDGLNFRSKTEIRIYDELVRHNVLVFPLPVAVIGEPRKYKEPDFLVCHQGKWGIIEIHGDQFHPPATAAKEHDRRREFTDLGVRVYEIFSADDCYNRPKEVVTRFLKELQRS